MRACPLYYSLKCTIFLFGAVIYDVQALPRTVSHRITLRCSSDLAIASVRAKRCGHQLSSAKRMIVVHTQQEAACGSSSLCSLPSTCTILLLFVYCPVIFSLSGQSHFSSLKLMELQSISVNRNSSDAF